MCYPQPFFLTSLNSFVRRYSTTETMHIKVKTTYSKTIPLILSDLLYIYIVIKISEKNFAKCTCTNIYRYVFVCDDQIIAHHVLQIHTMPTDFDIPVTVKIINSCCTSNSVSSFSYNHSAGIKARVTSKVWKKNAKYFCSHISLF